MKAAAGLMFLALCLSGCQFQFQTTGSHKEAPENMRYELKVFSHDGKTVMTEYTDKKPYQRFNNLVWENSKTKEEEEFHLGSDDSRFGYSIKLVDKE